MQKATLVKVKVKQLLKNIDTERSEFVMLQLFDDILKLHNIALKELDRQRLKQKYVRSVAGTDKIQYKEAVAVLTLDMTTLN